MKTDKKTMVEVLRKAADNIENGLDKNDSIQAMYGGNEWEDRTTNDLCFVEGVLYRIKPQTITVNGVEIPKPLGVGEINNLEHDSDCYCPSFNSKKYNNFSRAFVIRSGEKLIYATKEEAIEASKKLFGIE